MFKTKEITPPSGWDEYGTPADWAAVVKEEKQEAQRQRWKALKSLFVRKCHEENDLSYIWPYLVVGFIALVLGRGYKKLKNGKDDFRYESVSCWDYAKLYAGWEVKVLQVNLKAVRYYIISDGDWDM